MGIGMPLFGAFAGKKKISRDATAWRWTSGLSGTVLLALTLVIGSGFVERIYYDYIFYPRVKAEDH
jgi:hypothetical protein